MKHSRNPLPQVSRCARHQPLRLVPILLALWLSACGGGGTTGPLIARDDSSAIKVAVVDSGFVVTHSEYRDQIDSYKVFPSGTATNQTSIQDSEDPHGTYVAQTIAGKTYGFVNQTGDVKLVLAKATPVNVSGDWFFQTPTIKEASIWAMDQGARVVNYSLGPMYLLDSHLVQTYNHAATKDVALVMAAGNDARNISTDISGIPDIFEVPAYTDVSLVVGAVINNGTTYELANYSNYAGSDTTVQSRFLVAQAPVLVAERDESVTLLAHGTSFTAPQVSAALGSLLAKWPHLTAAQSTSILLDTANKTNSIFLGGYDPSLYGQGLLDLSKALQPVGTTSLPTAGTVGGAGVSVMATNLNLAAAFGDAMTGQVVNAALFDSYGRDFTFNLAHRLSSTGTHSSSHQWLSRMGETQQDVQLPSSASSASFDATGSMQRTRISLAPSDQYRLHWQRARGRAFEADEQPAKLLTLNGQGSLSSYDWLDQLGVQWSFGAGKRVDAKLTRASTSSGASSIGPEAWRHEAGLSFEAGSATAVTVGYATTTESQGLLGATGTGGLALDRSFAHSAILSLQRQLGNGWTAFGRAEWGSIAVQGSSLLTSMRQVRTSEWAAGLAWTGEDRQWTVALSQPIRVESATLDFDLPVGRTLDGTVLRQNSSVRLAPSGRQINVELAYRQSLGGPSARHGTLGLHAILARDAGHVAGASDWALLASYRRGW